ncbi:MAG: DUF4912 domain-containing protein [Fibrobacteraceae bacterium]|nr:DUF4912 domain-containing protein [Fibrobacteraceae bacterium]
MAEKKVTSKVKATAKTVTEKAESVKKKAAEKIAKVKAVAKAATKATEKLLETKKRAATKSSTKEASKDVVKKTVTTKSATAKSVATKSSSKKTTATKVSAAKTPATKAKSTSKTPSTQTTTSLSRNIKAPGTASIGSSFDAEYLVMMQKDPNWMQAFWEVSEKRIKEVRNGKGRLVLRLFDVSGDLTVLRNKKKKFHDIEVPADARSWYVETKQVENCVATLGVAQGKNFMPLTQTVPVETYSMEGANVKSDDMFFKASLGGASMGGFGSSGLSSMSAKNWLESLSSSSGSMFSGALSSAALKSNKLEAPKDSINYGKDFFLWVKTRLIVYGGTRPDAHLQVRGQPFPLNPDGTFSFEEDLPDSSKIIPVFATDKDGDFPTTIVPIVVKRTE